MFKTNLTLRNEVKDLRGEYRNLMNRFCTAAEKVGLLERTLKLRDGQLERVRKQATDLADDLHKQGKMVREQTASDLLVNALEAVGVIPKAKEKTLSDYQVEAKRLQHQQQAALGHRVSPYGGAFGPHFDPFGPFGRQL